MSAKVYAKGAKICNLLIAIFYADRLNFLFTLIVKPTVLFSISFSVPVGSLRPLRFFTWRAWQLKGTKQNCNSK